MRFRIILIIIASALLGIVHASFVRALPAPFDGIMMPLILVVSLIASFRFKEAFLAAFVSGLMLDALSSLPTGTETVAMLALTGVTIVLFTHVFTNHTWSGTLGINAAAFLMYRALYWIIDAVRATLAGMTFVHLPVVASLGALLAALLLQLAIALAAIGLSFALLRYFSRFFFLRRTRA